MTWWGVGAAAVSVVGSVYSSSQAAAGQASAMSAQSIAENDAIAKQNMNQMVRNSYRTGMANLQLGLNKKQAVQQGFDTTVQAQQLLGNANANIAAAGQIGASTDAVVNDIQMKLGEAQAQQKDSYEIMLENYNSELEANKMNALQSTVEARRFEYKGPSTGQMWGTAILGAAASYASSYALRQSQLGLGPQVQSQSGSMRGLAGGSGVGQNLPASFNRWGG